jgi:hypothetical protein
LVVEVEIPGRKSGGSSHCRRRTRSPCCRRTASTRPRTPW